MYPYIEFTCKFTKSDCIAIYHKNPFSFLYLTVEFSVQYY